MNTRARLWVMSIAVLLEGACGGAAVQRVPDAPVVKPSPEEPALDASASPKRVGPTDEERAHARYLWQASLVARAEGDEVAVRRTLMRLVRTAPGTAESVDARVTLAEEALARRDWSGAREWVVSLDAAGDSGYQRFRVLALAYEGQTSYSEAADAWLAAAERAADAGARQKSVQEAAQDLFLGGRLSEARRYAADTNLDLRDRVAPRLNGQVLASLAELVPEDDPDHGWLALRRAQALCVEGELQPCRSAAMVASQSTEPVVRAEAERLLARVTAWDEVHTTKLGILLPLSGRFQSHGQSALEGIQQALAGMNHIDLVVRDTGGQPAQAAQGAQELILDEHVAMILGPIGEQESKAAVTSAARFRVPHMVLSSSSSVAEGVPTALKMRLSAGEKVKALARYAVTEMGLKRAAILVPEQRARRRQMASFWDEFVRLGGEVRGVEVYDPGRPDIKGAISNLLGNSQPGKGTIDFEALFIPDDALQVRKLVPLLKYYGVRVKTHPRPRKRSGSLVQLLGVEAWNSAAVIDGEGLTNNAVFVDTFIHDPDDPHNDRFVRGFYARHRRKPNAFQAEVFDMMNIVARAMKPLDGTDHGAREALMASLLSTKHHRGVTGHITILDDGAMVLKPRLLTVHLEDIRLRVSEEEETYLRRSSGVTP